MSPRPIAKAKKEKDLCEDEVLRLSRLALDVSSDSCIWGDRKGRIVYANETACHALGYTKNELLSMKVQDIDPINDESKYPQAWDEAKRLGSIKFETVHMRKDGSRFPVAMTVNFLKLGEREYLAAFIRDITERKRAEEALRESEESYRGLVESTDDWVWETDKDFILTYDSPKSREFLGYEPDEVVGRSPFSFMPEDELERIKLTARPVIARHEPIPRIENRLKKKDGSTVIIETTGVPLFDDSGHFRGYRGVNRDITERKRAEEALREGEEKYRGLVEQVNDWVWEIDANCVYTYASPRVCELLGYEPGEVVGTTPFDYMAPDEAGRVKALFAPLLSEPREFLLLENTLVKKEGGTVMVETSGVPIYDDQHNFSGYRGIDRNITERKRAEEALAFERSQLLSIFDSIDDVVYVTDPYTYEVLYANKAMKEKFGGDLVGGVCYREFQKRDSPCDFCTNSIILKDKGKPYRWEYYNPKVGRYFMITDRIIRWPDGRDVRFEIAKDITERKRAEEALRDAKQQAELYLDLMGHDINNMHQIALGYLELALGMPPGVQLDEMIGKSVEVLQRSTQLIRNVRKLQKVNEDFLQMHEVDVGGMLHAVRREFGSVSGKGVTLNFNCEEHCFVRANELLHDVFANLVGNAIKHTGDKADINIDLDIVNDNGGKYCRVSVEDNGPGITDNFKGIIFNRMLKGTNKSKGMGLGLYLVKSLVESYGGRVWAEDRVKGDHTKGARFVVMLPAVDN